MLFTDQLLENADLADLIPQELQASSQSRLLRLIEARQELTPLDLELSQAQRLARALACSEFITTQLCRQPQWLEALLEEKQTDPPLNKQDLSQALALILTECNDETKLMSELRFFRNQIMTRIAWRDINGLSEAGQTMADLSVTADVILEQTLAQLFPWLCQQLGTPMDSQGQTQELMILAMGKLGAGELNFSSDVDLIFVYGEDGQTQGTDRTTENSQFFIRLGQQLINVLNQTTAEGFVYRVDMRLRPFGDSGPLAISIDALENYVHTHGREWERYAMVKARAITGMEADKTHLSSVLKPFCYRRYLDYSIFRGLREMKRLILQEVKRKKLETNIKLGAGGIREIEFIGQAFQLIRGGREPRLQIRPIQKVLNTLTELNLLPSFVTEELQAAYVFLRDTEHRLQEVNDQQTHHLPSDELEQLRLAFAMGFPSWLEFKAVLDRHQTRVRSHFEQVVASTPGEGGDEQDEVWRALWHDRLDEQEALTQLENLGYGDSKTTLKNLRHLHRSRYRVLSNEGRERLDTLIPFLLQAAAGKKDADQTLALILQLVEAVAKRTAYLALLSENPLALSQLVKLCAGSPWIATLLTQHPLLLDELLDPRTLYAPPFREELGRDLNYRLQNIPADDLEQQMDTLRQFKQANVLRVAAADIMEAIPLMEVSNHLTWIAEVILLEALGLAWQDMSLRHGYPPGKDQLDSLGFAILGYGKLGGLELGYGSDLDLVFLYYPATANEMTDGPKPLSVPVFFTRMGQRLIHILNTYTHAGILYEVDTRLRPSGASGMLVSNIEGFFDYQRKKAWTWEHQALVRARFIAGDPQLGQAFDRFRAQILCQTRDHQQLRQDVREMREKMRLSLDKSDAEGFDLKQGHGGIADIEFLVQYAVLAWAAQYPELTKFTDNVRLLECLGKNGLISASDAQALSDTYRYCRNRAHKMILQDQAAIVPASEVEEITAKVKQVWQGLLGN